MIFLSQAAQAATTSANDFWWAQPGATLLGGALVFAAAWVAYAAQANTREQERTHHKERLAEERKARAELVGAQREEWEARIVHERTEARRTETLHLYGNMLALVNSASTWASGGFSEFHKSAIPDDARADLVPILAPREVVLRFSDFGEALRQQDANAVKQSVQPLRVSMRKHLRTFDAPPRLSDPTPPPNE